MSKLVVENPVEHTRVPFLRGILVHSLQDAGLNFKQAHQIASEIRDELSTESSISSMSLQQRAIGKLSLLDNPTYQRRYRDRSLPKFIQVEMQDGQLSEFSPSEYRNNLEAIGLKAGEALAIVGAVNKHLLKRKVNRVTSKYIAYFTYRLLRRSQALGPAVARRWLIWRDFVDSGRPLVILLGGTAGTGKSTVASDLASRLNIVRTQSTDMLREVMRSVVSKEAEPLLHQSSFSAWTEFSTLKKKYVDADELLVGGFCKQANILGAAIDAVMQRAVREGVSLIVEGVHIQPGGNDRWEQVEGALVVPVMLAVLKPKALRRRIAGRSVNAPQRRAQHYLDYFDSIWKLQSYLLSEADQAGVPIIINGDREYVFREIMLTIIGQLSQSFDKTSEQVFG